MCVTFLNEICHKMSRAYYLNYIYIIENILECSHSCAFIDGKIFSQKKKKY